jgi:hypothetical protein
LSSLFTHIYDYRATEPWRIKIAEERKAKAHRVAAKMVARCPPDVKTLEGLRSIRDAIFEGYMYYYYTRSKRGHRINGMKYIRDWLGKKSNHPLKPAVEQGEPFYLF